VVFNGYLLHRSPPNVAKQGPRRALVDHYMSAESLPWTTPPAGVRIASWDYRDVVMVAGTDPYAYKGITNELQPYIRPDHDGGCHR
jgi:phytanoyl-CoA hydroxylase